MLTTTEARRELARHISWMGDEMNHVTFERLVSEELLAYAGRVPNGARLFFETDVKELAKKLPRVRPPNRIGIIGWLQGRRPKNKGAEK